MALGNLQLVMSYWFYWRQPGYHRCFIMSQKFRSTVTFLNFKLSRNIPSFTRWERVKSIRMRCCFFRPSYLALSGAKVPQFSTVIYVIHKCDTSRILTTYLKLQSSQRRIEANALIVNRLGQTNLERVAVSLGKCKRPD